jgi:endonuclease/exonuclease/phosphatase family metal-dependent hydrolase
MAELVSITGRGRLPGRAGLPGVELMKLGTYNVHRCVGGDRRYNVDRVARVIGELGCDTVGLQEVDNRPGARLPSMQLERLAHATGMRAVAGNALAAGDLYYGNALLTTRRIGAIRRYDLSVSGREPRAALDVELLGGSGSVRVIVTHLGLQAAERREQVRKLLRVLESIPSDCLVAVVGDINEWLPVGRPLRWLHGSLGKSPRGRSFPVWAPLLALDRIWARPPGALLTLNVHRSREARAASDHFPVKAVVALWSRNVDRAGLGQ